MASGTGPTGLSSFMDIPAELQFIIAENTVKRHSRSLLHGIKDDLQDIYSLSLTCKALREVCEPVLYRRVILLPPKSILQFLKMIIATPRIAPYVRSLHLPKAERSLGLLQQDTAWVGEATKIMESDSVARGLLRDGTIRLEILVMIAILQRLPSLREFCASLNVFHLGLWPEDQRFVGSSITGLHIKGYDPATYQSFPVCEGLGSFMKAFRSNCAPASLEELYIEHRCRPGEDREHREVGSDWVGFAPTLERLHIHTYPFFALETMLQASPKMTHLCVREATMKLDQTMRAIEACPQLANTLQVLEMSFMWEQPLYRELQETLAPLSNLADLRQLRMPMPLDTPRTARLPKLPPKLEDLTVTWTRNDLNRYGAQHFASVLGDALQDGNFPKSLRCITLEWYGDEIIPGAVRDGNLILEDLIGLVPVVEALESICDSKRVMLFHGASSTDACLDSEAFLHHLRGIIEMGTNPTDDEPGSLLDDDEDGWEDDDDDEEEYDEDEGEEDEGE